jgi:Uncharacterised protein, DegV family COG1307
LKTSRKAYACSKMPRPAVLLVEPQAARRKELSRGLSSLGYEVIPAIDERQGRRFMQEMGELGPPVVVAPLGFVDPRAGAPTPEGSVETGNGSRRTLLLLGEREEDGQHLPGEVSYLATGGLAAGELVRRVHVLLLGREVGVEADSQLASLVGDLELTPLLELLRALQRAEVSGRLVHAGGEVTLVRGQVVAAIGHSNAPIWADRLRALLAERFHPAELMVTEIGPVVGTHSGPGTVGAALFQPTAEELPLIAPLSEPAEAPSV